MREGAQAAGAGGPVVAFVADEAYVVLLAAAMASLLANADGARPLRLFIVDAGVSPRSRERLARLADDPRVKMEWIRPADTHRSVLRSLPIGFVGRSCYYKMFIAELLGAAYPRIIFLDSDLVLEADIHGLWEADLDDQYVLAVQDLLNPYVSSPLGIRRWRQLGRAEGDAVFNAGVMVVNADLWRKTGVSARLLAYLQDNYRDVRLCDQEALNVVFGNRWGRLDLRWNVLPDMKMARGYSLLNPRDHQQLLDRAWVLHFCGPGKPTNVSCRHPRRDRFFHYLAGTAWADWRPSVWNAGLDVAAYYARRARAGSLRAFHLRRGRPAG